MDLAVIRVASKFQSAFVRTGELTAMREYLCTYGEFQSAFVRTGELTLILQDISCRKVYVSIRLRADR